MRNIAAEASPYTVGRDDVDGLELDYSLEDDSRHFAGVHSDVGEHHIALRFSSQVKDPVQGFTFGRSVGLCDICLRNDPNRRLSKIHFRIYLNEWGVLMLEDMSTNGTVVDQILLKKKDGPAGEVKRTLESGSKIKILMHEPGRDIVFLVRIPIREGAHEDLYKHNLQNYQARRTNLASVDVNRTIVPGPGGHVRFSSPFLYCRCTDGHNQVDIFKPAAPRQNGAAALHAQPQDGRGAQRNRSRSDGLPRPWTGSDKYNRVREIGRGAFATVHKVTLKLTGHPYAAKELDKRKFMKNGVLDQKVENEMNIMQRIKHVRHLLLLDPMEYLLTYPSETLSSTLSTWTGMTGCSSSSWSLWTAGTSAG